MSEILGLGMKETKFIASGKYRLPYFVDYPPVDEINQHIKKMKKCTL